MKKLFLMMALALGFALVGPGAGSDAQAKPHGWHKKHGHHYGWRHHPGRHYGWYRGRHHGWYKHRSWYGYHSPRYW